MRNRNRSIWAPSSNIPYDVGSTLSLFAIGAIAAAGELNPLQTIRGLAPSSGDHLTVEWRFSYLVLGLIALAHLFIFTIMSALATPVVVKENGYLAIGKLLQRTS